MKGQKSTAGHGLSEDKMLVFTVGHSTRKPSEFIGILEAYGIKEVIDIRTMPRSRANPQFNGSALAKALKRRRIRYKHMKGLGGLRRPDKNSINTYWRNASFRGFADYMSTNEFRDSIDELIDASRKKRVAIMCAEAVPWRCHRSLIADSLLVRGIRVNHIFSSTNSRDHELTKSAVMRRKRIIYTLSQV